MVLHSNDVENSTVTICPITSLIDKKTNKAKKTKAWHLILKKDDYPCLDGDSYVKTDQIITVDRAIIDDIKRPSFFTTIDLISLDLKIIALFEMAKTVKDLIKEENRKEIDCIVNEIDKELKEQVEKGIKDLLRIINRRIKPLITEVTPEKQEELIKTIIHINMDIIIKVNEIIDEVLRTTKEKYIAKYKEEG